MRRAALAAALLAAAPAAAADRDRIEAGLQIWRSKANCQTCHGWAGDGRKMDSQMPDGADLRVSQLDRDGLVLTIKCGRPGAGMPAYDKFAYSDGRCYGMTAADLRKAELTLADPAATLQPREIDLVIDFLVAKVIGQGEITAEKCVEFWGEKVAVCDELK
jgi:mono/diheme cytochrome c family protein